MIPHSGGVKYLTENHIKNVYSYDVPHPKPFKTLDEQIQLLQERELHISSIEAAKTYLAHTHYYRFTGYSRFWQINPSISQSDFNKYHPSADFDTITKIIESDAKVRSMLFESASKVELAVRSLLAHKLSSYYPRTPGFYLNPAEYDGKIPLPTGHVSEKRLTTILAHNNECEEVISNLIRGIKRDLDNSKSPAVRHYQVTTEDGKIDYSKLPLWVAVEHISFGKLSLILAYAKRQEAVKEVANECNIQYKDFAETIHALSVLRNLCAHHKQLWNTSPVAQVPKSRRAEKNKVGLNAAPNSFYNAVTIMRHILTSLRISCRGLDKLDTLLKDNEIYREYFTHPVGFNKTVWDNSCHALAEYCCENQGNEELLCKKKFVRPRHEYT